MKYIHMDIKDFSNISVAKNESYIDIFISNVNEFTCKTQSIISPIINKIGFIKVDYLVEDGRVLLDLKVLLGKDLKDIYGLKLDELIYESEVFVND